MELLIMFRHIWKLVFGVKRPEVLLIPSSQDLPELWMMDEQGRYRPQLECLDQADSQTLMALCDDYWDSYFEDFEHPVVRSHDIDYRAIEILGNRGDTAISWAYERLSHPGYDARKRAADLLGVLGSKGLLGERKQSVVEALAELATHPWKEDTKEVQANTSAVLALEKIGGDNCIDVMKTILTSPVWDQDCLQIAAVEILSRVTEKNFMDEEDPLAAAKAWVRER